MVSDLVISCMKEAKYMIKILEIEWEIIMDYLKKRQVSCNKTGQKLGQWTQNIRTTTTIHYIEENGKDRVNRERKQLSKLSYKIRWHRLLYSKWNKLEAEPLAKWGIIL